MHGDSGHEDGVTMLRVCGRDSRRASSAKSESEGLGKGVESDGLSVDRYISLQSLTGKQLRVCIRWLHSLEVVGQNACNHGPFLGNENPANCRECLPLKLQLFCHGTFLLEAKRLSASGLRVASCTQTEVIRLDLRWTD